MTPRTKVFEVAVFDTGDGLETDIGEQADNEGQYAWWLIVASLRIALELEQLWKRILAAGGAVERAH